MGHYQNPLPGWAAILPEVQFFGIISSILRAALFFPLRSHSILAHDLAAIRHIRTHPEDGQKILSMAADFRKILIAYITAP